MLPREVKRARLQLELEIAITDKDGRTRRFKKLKERATYDALASIDQREHA